MELTRARHAWMSYMVDKPPSEDKILQRNLRVWEPPMHRPNMTATKSAFKTYNTYDSSNSETADDRLTDTAL